MNTVKKRRYTRMTLDDVSSMVSGVSVAATSLTEYVRGINRLNLGAKAYGVVYLIPDEVLSELAELEGES